MTFTHTYRNVNIDARNAYGMYSALVLVTRDQYVKVSADSLSGMFRVIRETLASHGLHRGL